MAAYPLPQVTGCRRTPETLNHIAADSRITMFKDSSGRDVVAASKCSLGGALLVRGSEGGYLDTLHPRGLCHGWLPSTGNALAAPLRRILALEREGRVSEAARLPAKVFDTVARVFQSAAQEVGANAFSNAIRAMDHLRTSAPLHPLAQLRECRPQGMRPTGQIRNGPPAALLSAVVPLSESSLMSRE